MSAPPKLSEQDAQAFCRGWLAADAADRSNTMNLSSKP